MGTPCATSEALAGLDSTQEKKLLTNSPLTGSSNVSFIRRLCVDQLVQDWKHQFNIDVAPEFRRADAIDVLRCNETGLVFFTPQNIAGSENLYAQLNKIEWYYGAEKWEHGLARGLFTAGERILDVGCGAGAFVSKALQVGVDARGIDLCPEAVEVGRSRGLPLAVGDIEVISSGSPESFDGVCAFQVLEHIAAPLKFLEACIRAVRSGGKLVLAVPNGNGYLKHSYDLLDLPPHHMSRWCAKTFHSLERLFPIDLQRVAYEPLAPNQQSWYVQALKKRLRRTPLGWVLGRERVLSNCVRLVSRLVPVALRGHSMCAVFVKR